VAIVDGCDLIPCLTPVAGAYLENLRHASPTVQRVSLADKLHNARSLLAGAGEIPSGLISVMAGRYIMVLQVIGAGVP